MKNKITLVFLPLLALTSCANNPEAFTPYVEYLTNGLPAVHFNENSSFTTYLMLSRYGELEISGAPVKGEVADKFYEETVVWLAEPGTELPVAKSTLPNVTFRGWAYYNEENENVWPDYYTTVQNTEFLALKAIFDGPQGGGGGGGGQGGGEVTTVTWTAKDFPTWVTDDGCVIFAWAWDSNGGNWYSLTYTSATSATFDAPSNLVGMLLARCAPNTTTPDWKQTEDGPGRVYNQTSDVTVTANQKEYSFPNSMWTSYNP